MKRFKKILWALPAVLVIIQFIRPAKNNSAAVPAQQVSAVFNVPAGVDSALRVSCYDCHSNKTHYPWYAEVQP
ncbi:MAG TPA: heme-binding domain-containing protein, partial [Bacteroidia bacterium]|nr:heme-binding domain-containing protein [Bacteroidia bacterium]